MNKKAIILIPAVSTVVSFIIYAISGFNRIFLESVMLLIIILLLLGWMLSKWKIDRVRYIDKKKYEYDETNIKYVEYKEKRNTLLVSSGILFLIYILISLILLVAGAY